MKHNDPDPVQPVQSTDPRLAPEKQNAERRPWVAPTFERLDLREAMAKASGTPSADGLGSS